MHILKGVDFSVTFLQKYVNNWAEKEKWLQFL